MYYFAYGSNMNPERMSERNISFSSRQLAKLFCFRLEFNKVSSRNPNEGYANIVPDKNSIIEGAVYEIPGSDLSTLDQFEGYPDHYQKIQVTIQLKNFNEVETITYIAHPDKIKVGLKPSKGYIKHLLAGEDILSKEYYRRLKIVETLD
jgi:gamma-glutamylcyclotransferase